MELYDSGSFSVGTDRKKNYGDGRILEQLPRPRLLVHVLWYPFPWVRTESVNMAGDSHSLEVTFYEMRSYSRPQALPCDSPMASTWGSPQRAESYPWPIVSEQKGTSVPQQ